MKNGAELECFLTYKNIDSDWVYRIADFLLKNNFLFDEEKALLCYGDDYVTPEIRTSRQGWERLKERNFLYEGFREVLLRTRGLFFDVKSEIFISIEFDINVITFSVFEGFLWKHDTNKYLPDIKRLHVYTSLCRSFARIFTPKYSTMTNLGIHSSDMAIESISEKRKKLYSYNENFLSDKEVNDLYDWYTKEYTSSLK